MTSNRSGRRPAHRLGVVALLLVLSAALTSCDLAPPKGPAPLRYRDAVFTGVTKQADIAYGSAVNQDGTTETLRFDLYTPTGDRRTGRPLIVWVHGGSFCCGSKTSPEIVDEANTFARKGYVNASISYRLSENGCRSQDAECIQAINDAIADAQAAVRFFRANAAAYGIDPGLISIAGTSAGAITALGVGYRVPQPTTSGTPGVSSAVKAAVSLSGGVLFVRQVGAGDAPALLFHGTADSLVPYSWARNTVDRAHTAGLPAYLITWQGEGHVPYTQHRQQILNLTSNFLYNTLDLSTTG
jgi:dipeptidyl aminopeptidase/acylaminoacyl peptidase